MATTTAVRAIAPSIAVPAFTWFTTASLLVSDALALSVSVALSVIMKAALSHHVEINHYLRLWPFLFVFLGVYAAVGLYSRVALSPPEELRRGTISSTVLFLALAAFTISFRGEHSRAFTGTLLAAIAISVALMPMMRESTRQICSRASWWGYPTVVFGSRASGRGVLHSLLSTPGLGLRPVAMLDDYAANEQIHGVPVVHSMLLPELAAQLQGPSYAIITGTGGRRASVSRIVERYGRYFSHVIVVPELEGFSAAWADPRSLGGMVGLEISRNALLKERSFAKLALDAVLGSFSMLLVTPLCALIAAAIRLDSAGPIFYSQERIGQHGQRFRAWKFRTMVVNADAVLNAHLLENPGLRTEWERDHKLRDDPRVTRVGRFLRIMSLDELPQLWNVLHGEMSLVGPRPIVDSEVPRYGDKFDLYTRVRGGLTGLWQVSGRSDTTYAERVNLDSWYVRNWSVWLDLCILFRTIAVVLFRKGAY